MAEIVRQEITTGDITPFHEVLKGIQADLDAVKQGHTFHVISCPLN